MNENMANLLNEAKHILAEIQNNLPSGFNIASISTRSKLPFKALNWREALIHRAAELTNSSLLLFEDSKYVSACILTRSLMETAGILFWIQKRIGKVVKEQDLGDIDTFLMQGLVGESVDNSRWKPRSATSAIQKVEKEYVGFQGMYDDLCQFVHPNWSGTSGSYSQIDYENMKVQFKSYANEFPMTFILCPLVKSLEICREQYNKFAEIFPEFVRVCENDFKKQST